MDFRWRCPVCSYVHVGPTRPDFSMCPVCGTPADEFVRENEPSEHFGAWTHQARSEIEHMARTGTRLSTGTELPAEKLWTGEEKKTISEYRYFFAAFGGAGAR